MSNIIQSIAPSIIDLCMPSRQENIFHTIHSINRYKLKTQLLYEGLKCYGNVRPTLKDPFEGRPTVSQFSERDKCYGN